MASCHVAGTIFGAVVAGVPVGPDAGRFAQVPSDNELSHMGGQAFSVGNWWRGYAVVCGRAVMAVPSRPACVVIRSDRANHHHLYFRLSSKQCTHSLACHEHNFSRWKLALDEAKDLSSLGCLCHCRGGACLECNQRQACGGLTCVTPERGRSFNSIEHASRYGKYVQSFQDVPDFRWADCLITRRRG